MTDPSPAAPNADARDRRVIMLSLGILLGLVALKAFALGASGSTAMRASLVESVLELIAIGSAVLIARSGQADDADRRRHAARLLQAGLVLASAVFVGWDAVVRIFLPWPVVGGPWPVVVAVLSLVAIAWLVRARHGNREGRPPYLGELATGVVALIGVMGGTLLNAPGLDAAAGLAIAVWLFWGGLALARPAPTPETSSR